MESSLPDFQKVAEFLHEVWRYTIRCNMHLWWAAFPFIAYFLEFLPMTVFWEKGIRSSSLPASGLSFLAVPSVLLWGEDVPSPLLLPQPDQWWLTVVFKAVDVLYVVFWWSVYWFLTLRWYPYWLFWRGLLHPCYREQMLPRMMLLAHPLSPYTIWTLWSEEFVNALTGLLAMCGLDGWTERLLKKRKLLRRVSPGNPLHGFYQYSLCRSPEQMRFAQQQWSSSPNHWSVHQWYKRNRVLWEGLPQVERDLLIIVDSRVSALWFDFRMVLEYLTAEAVSVETSNGQDKYRWLLQDFGRVLKHEIRTATQLRQRAYGRSEENYPYVSGYLIGLNLAARLLLETAKAFDLSAQDVGLEGLEMDPALLFRPWEQEEHGP